MEVCACTIVYGNHRLAIVSVYIPPSTVCHSPLNPLHLYSLIQQIPCQSLLICGDFNAHHYSWGGRSSDQRGNTIHKFIDDERLVLLNDGSNTFFGATQSAIDLTICSPNISINCSWSTSNELLGSSHCVVTTQISFSNHHAYSPKLSLPRAINKAYLNRKVKEIFEQRPSPSEYEEFIADFREFFSSVDAKKVKPPNPWWNANCNRVMAAQRLALRNFKRNPSRSNYEKLKQAQCTYKYTIRAEKSKGWKAFCNSIDSNMTVKEFWRIVKSFKGTLQNSIDGFRECVIDFCNNLAGPAGPVLLPTPTQPQQSHMLTQPFTLDELNKALSAVRNSAPGLDGLSNDHLKNFNDDNRSHLLSLLNHILSSGVIPDSWLDYKVIPLKKKAPMLH